MPRFSLIVATINRTKEFADLLQSLAEQEMHDFELIVVDQNPDGRLDNIWQSWTAKFVHRSGGKNGLIWTKYFRCAPGLSRARNLGLSHSTGEILAFPDDDCWYPAGTLQFIDDWFNKHQEYDILSLGSRDENERISGNRWPQRECDLTNINAFRTSATYTYFVRRPQPIVPLKFDEMIGPGAGTPFGAGEDTDFLLTLMSYGARGRFNSTRHIGHPFKPYADVDRAKGYGGGFGRVLAKHSLPFLCFGLVSFDVARAAIHLVLGNYRRASVLWAHGRSMFRAYFSG